MNTYSNHTLLELFSKSVFKYGDNQAFTYYNQYGYSYTATQDKVLEISNLLSSSGIGIQDKVVILNPNGPHWAITYFAVTTSARVAVPLLIDYSEYEINALIQHSDSKALFVTRKLFEKISEETKKQLNLIVDIQNFSIIYQKEEQVQVNDLRAPEPSDTAVIIYTSGTTGIPKGVMLSHLNLCSQIDMCYSLEQVEQEDVFLSLLPMSHAYECSLGMLLPFSRGASVNYIDKLPTPTILAEALKRVRPTHLLMVPLVMEKIYKTKILPTFTSRKLMRFLYAIPVFRKMFNKIAGKKLYEFFGGRLKFLGIGGAKLDNFVERFLQETKIVPYAIGYGLTEAAPLLAGATPKKVKLSSTGYKVNSVELKLTNINVNTGVGEIIAKGANIMQGYYKNPEATKAAFTEEGWLKTNDLAAMDETGRIYIKGRLGNMIVGPTGENIYPEEIEEVINQHELVLESLVKDYKGKLVAMVYLNYEQLEQAFITTKDETIKTLQDAVETIKNEIVEYVNARVSKFARISIVVEQPTPFDKTATQKIKRFKYL